MLTKYNFYLAKLFKSPSTWIISILFWLFLIASIFFVPWIIPNKPISFFLLFVDQDMNVLLIVYICVFIIIFSFTKIYNLFLSKKIENKKDFWPKYFAFITINLIMNFVTWIIITSLIFSTEHYKTIENYILLDVMYFVAPFLGSIFIGMIFLSFNALIRIKIITIPILTIIFLFFSGWIGSVVQYGYVGGSNNKEYTNYWINESTRIDYHQKYENNKTYFIPYYLTSDPNNQDQKNINLLTKNGAITNLLVKSLEDNKKSIITKQVQIYIIPTGYIANTIALDLNFQNIYQNYYGKYSSEDIGFITISQAQSTSIVATSTYYKEINYANNANDSNSLKLSSTNLIEEIDQKINNKSKINNQNIDDQNYLYFELKDKINPQWSTLLILITETALFSYLSSYLINKKGYLVKKKKQ